MIVFFFVSPPKMAKAVINYVSFAVAGDIVLNFANGNTPLYLTECF